MRKYQMKRLNKILLILTIVLVVLAIIIGVVIYVNTENKKKQALYEDKLVCNNYFSKIIVDFKEKKVKRDDIKTTMQEEFNVTEEQENIILSSKDELVKFFEDTVFEIQVEENTAYITNKYQTKRLLIEVDTLNGEFNEAKVSNLSDNIYLLEYDTQKRTKAAYENINNIDWIKKVEIDEVIHIETINDESQTVYGEKEEQTNTKYNSFGIKAMGLSNYKNIINENGNPFEVVVTTIGYGVCIENKYFEGRINDKYYNFIEDSKNIPETIPQGSRVAEVIKDATPNNVQIMPLVVVNNEGYSTISTIIKAIEYGIQNSDIICYELIHRQDYMINLILEKAFKENKPFCCVTADKNNKQIYPANNATTIAVSSINKKGEIATYSGRGEYIDFTAHSTDVEEIFTPNSTVSKWSGAQYSNAHIVSAIALIKTYHKDYTILEIYNILRNYCIDLGTKGKDEKFGYGCPSFSKLTIADIDKEVPDIKEIQYDNEKWEKSKQIQIIATDNIRILSWAVTESTDIPKEWNKLEKVQSTLDITHEIKENGKYYIWVKDSAGNISYSKLEINKIDIKAPEISYKIDTSAIETDGYVTISVKAQDKDSGLNKMAYSWDGEIWGTENNILKVTENGRHKVYTRDVLGNVSEKEILVDVFPRAGIANINDGIIIKSIIVPSNWNGNTNNSVRITFNEGLNIVGWKITTSNEIPDYFEEIYIDEEYDEEIIDENYINENELVDYDENIILEDEEIEEQPQGYNLSFTITKALKTNTTYYVWVKDVNDNIITQTFTIEKVKI